MDKEIVNLARLKTINIKVSDKFIPAFEVIDRMTDEEIVFCLFQMTTILHLEGRI